ncbi:hypothetical protein HK102_009774 [Quaeritorhiza haematococci]|nr:hypothetical protein HK102_009774 [Quaeritorhiza haematococci]
MVKSSLYGLFVICFVCTCARGDAGDRISVVTSLGPFLAFVNHLNNVEFLGIEYAVADRWEEPRNPPAITKIRDASVRGPSCPQKCVINECPPEISERCLFLNVYTPFGEGTFTAGSNGTVRPPTNASVPVLLVIHGGSFEKGSASSSLLAGSDLAAQTKAIVVTFNYRLALFGFLDLGGLDASTASTSTPANIPINFGIMDQRMAIDWVLENIAAFGGDPRRVTILGQSAGGLSAFIHMSDPQIRNRVKNYVLMSPPATALRTRSQSQTAASRLARELGCTSSGKGNSTSTKACMIGKATNDVLNAMGERYTTDDSSTFSELALVLVPVIDGVDIRGTYMDLLRTEPSVLSGLNIIVGSTSNETVFFFKSSGATMGSPVFNVMVNALFRTEAPAVQRFYETSSMGFLEDRTDVAEIITTDWLFACPLKKAIRNRPPNGNLYSYIFETGWTGSSNLPIGDFCNKTACHGSDMALLFQNSTNPQLTQVASFMKTYLGRFLWTSDVNNNTFDAQTLPRWPKLPASPSTEMPLLRFPKPVGSQPSSVTPILDSNHPRKRACEFWDRLGYYPLNDSISRFTVDLHGSVLGITWGFWSLVVLLQLVIIVIMNIKMKRIIDSPPPINRISRTEISKSKADLVWTENSNFGVVLACNYLNYRVGDRFDGKQILFDVSFMCQPGTITGLIGSSGSGKTTLLSLISRHIPSIEAGRKVTFNGNPLETLGWKALQSILAYVGHQEPPFDGLTPREVLIHAALMGQAITEQEVVRIISQTLADFQLEGCADVVIGKENSISAGQRRKLSLAVVLLRSPNVLILDEPTSGLDARSALDLMEMLQFLAQKRGKTIICSIHQPRQEIFELFSQVLVMTTGRVVFAGSLQKSKFHFGSMLEDTDSSSESISNETNFADKMLDLVSEISISNLTRLEGGTDTRNSYNQERRPLSTRVFHRARLITTITTLNYRWWITRPLTYKLQMLAVICVTIPLSLIQRRFHSGMDLISLSLITKGMMYALLFLPSIKNIAMSFDFYTDWDMFVADFGNGRSIPIAFYLHRLIYDNALSFVEGMSACFLTYSLVGGDLAPNRTFTIVSLFTLYYQAIVSIFMVIYSLPFSRPEARSVTFLVQMLVGFTSGVLIKPEDTAVYRIISYVQYINPTYWAVASVSKSILSGTGECLVRSVSQRCEATQGDLLLENFRIDPVDPTVGMACLLALFFAAKLCHFGALLWTLHVRQISSWFKSKSRRKK